MSGLSRREFFSAVVKPAAAIILIQPALMHKALAAVKNTTDPPEDIAGDESFWFEIQQAYTADRSMINLNNGGVSPAPAIVQEAMKRHLDYSNTSPAYSMWRILEPQREPIRQRLARFFQCDTEEVAFTRNAPRDCRSCKMALTLILVMKY